MPKVRKSLTQYQRDILLTNIKYPFELAEKVKNKSPVDWSYWQNIPTCELYKIVYLALGIDLKDTKSIESGLYKAAESENCVVTDKINSLLDIAVANLEENGGTLKVFLYNSRNPLNSVVRLSDFKSWFESMSLGYLLPDQFQAAKASSAKSLPDGESHLDQTKQDNYKNGVIDVKEYNSLTLMLLAMAMDKYSYNPKNRNAATGSGSSSIFASVDKLGLSIDDDTVRTHLKKAYEIHKDSLKLKPK